MFKLFQPVLIFAFTWLLVILLFSLRLSSLLKESISDAWFFYLISTLPFFLGYTVSFAFRKNLNLGAIINFRIDEKSYEKKFNQFFKVWLIITIIEIIYSKGFPALWLITNSGKSYHEYGIPSIHGFINALGLSLSLISYYFYKTTSKKKFLIFTISFILWNLMLITRQVVITLLIEILVLNFYLSKNKLKVIFYFIFYGLIGIISFGILGDLRSGSEAFLKLAGASENWPKWLPSGFLWVYMYVTTPLNNLLYNFTFEIKTSNWLFPNTFSLLFPTIIRTIIFGEDYTNNGNLVTQAFNVSSAFSGPYLDAGYYGIMIFSLISGIFVNIVWWSKQILRLFYRAIIVQILVLSIFYNMFVYLPVIFQLVCVSIYFYGFNNKNILK
ncbi:MAG: oligosaccharide repeat unit polymerase [Flavobacterium sp.]|nr:oligosaccharide repeat unit polymerase [Flavobacterium sp.]